MDAQRLIVTALIGLVAGWLGSLVVGGVRGGLLGLLVAGLVGGVVGGMLLGGLRLTGNAMVDNIIQSAIGAMIVIVLARLLF